MNELIASCAASNLIHNILNGNSSLEVICTDTLEDLSSGDNKIDGLVLKLIENWAAGVNDSKNTECMFSCGSGNVSTQNVVNVVELLKCQKVFCQILFLIPEKTKRKLILDVCQRFKEADMDQYCQLRKVFLEEACTNYSQNIMYKLSELHKSVIKCFFSNMSEIIQYTCGVTPDNIIFFLHFINNILGKLELFENSDVDHINNRAYQDYDYNSFALLNKNGKEQVERLLLFCKSHSNPSTPIDKRGSIPTDPRDTVNNFMKILQMKSYSSLLMILFPILSEHLDYIDLKDNVQIKTMFFRILLKVKGLSCLLNTAECTCPNKQTLFIATQAFIDKIREQCIDDNVVENICNCVGLDEMFMAQQLVGNEADDRMLISKWKLESNIDKKFSMAVSSVGNLYYGHKEMLSWLLSHEDLKEKHANTLIACLATYTINYGSVTLIYKYMSMLHERKQTGNSNCLNYSIQQVVLRCLPYLNVKCCNRLISSCKEYIKCNECLLWSSKYTKEHFQSSLKEIINKLTSDRSDNKKIFCSLAQLSIVSPLLILQEIIGRIFGGTLKYSVLKSVLLTVSAFFELDSFETTDECESPIIVYIKNAYMKNKNKQNSSSTLIAILVDLIEVVPDSFKSDFFHNIINSFILPNLMNDGSKVFLHMGVTMEIMKKCLQDSNINILSLKCNISLCKLLLDFLNKGDCDNDVYIHTADVYDSVNKAIKLLILNVTNKFKDSSLDIQESILSSIKMMLENYSWSYVFYFYSFFLSIGYLYRYMIPSFLFEFCGSSIEDMLIPLQSDLKEVDEGKWIALFQISIVSRKSVLLFLDQMPIIVADDEVPNIIQAVAEIFSDYVSIYKAKAVVGCLRYIVAKEKIEGISSYFREDLCNEYFHHGTCFSMLILIQSFILQYSDVDETLRCQKHNDVQNYMKTFHLFLLHAKEIDDIEVRSSILLYLFEQLMYTTTLLGDFITNILSLLLMDVLIMLLDTIKSLSEDRAGEVTEECANILSIAEGDHSIALWDKYNMALNS